MGQQVKYIDPSGAEVVLPFDPAESGYMRFPDQKCCSVWNKSDDSIEPTLRVMVKIKHDLSAFTTISEIHGEIHTIGEDNDVPDSPEQWEEWLQHIEDFVKFVTELG